MVVWVKRAVLCALLAGCGGRAERHVDPDGPEANGGTGVESAGAPSSGGTTAAGSGGSSAVAGGGGVLDPSAGAGGVDDGAGTPNDGGTSWDGFTGPPPGTPIGTKACDRGLTTNYAGLIPDDVEEGFHGILDGTPVLLARGAPAPGAMSASSPQCKALTMELLFDGAFEGDQLTLYFNSDDSCITQGWYVPKGGSPEPIAGDIALHVWPGDEVGTGVHFVYGALSLRAKGFDGGVTHTLEGEFSVYVVDEVCIG
jgi:hypothetical protein